MKRVWGYRERGKWEGEDRKLEKKWKEDGKGERRKD